MGQFAPSNPPTAALIHPLSPPFPGLRRAAYPNGQTTPYAIAPPRAPHSPSALRKLYAITLNIASATFFSNPTYCFRQ